MTPQDFENFPIFGDNGTKVQPGDPKYAAGFIPGDVLPAEWLNWFLNTLSKGYNQLVQHANEGFIKTISTTQTLIPAQEMSVVIDTASVTLTLGSGPYVGYTLPVLATAACSVSYTGSGGATTDSLPAGSVITYTYDGAKWLSFANQLLQVISDIINQVRLEEQQRPAVGVPTIWLGQKPTWALDFGNGASTQYLWANYPKLNNDKFKNILDTFKTTGGNGLCSDYDNDGFYVPDLRGMMPKSYGQNDKGYAHDGVDFGQVLSERLPNIRGSISTEIAGQSFIPMINASGALHSAQYTANTIVGLTATTGNQYNGIGLNASNTPGTGAGVYLEGAHVTPLCFGIMWIVRFE